MKKLCTHDKKILKMAPSYYSHSTIDGRRYMIMEYLESQVDDFIAKYQAG